MIKFQIKLIILKYKIINNIHLKNNKKNNICDFNQKFINLIIFHFKILLII